MDLSQPACDDLPLSCYLRFFVPGHHELPPVAHTTMLRDFPTSLQRYREAVIPSHPSASPVSRAAFYHQHNVSQGSQQREAAAPHTTTTPHNVRRTVPALVYIVHWLHSVNSRQSLKPQSVVFTSRLRLCLVVYCVSQFQSAAGARDANANRGQHIDGKKSGQNWRSSIVLPVYLTEDNLTLAVLSLLLGGWLVVVVTFPIVS